jgi:hypothetical protein
VPAGPASTRLVREPCRPGPPRLTSRAGWARIDSEPCRPGPPRLTSRAGRAHPSPARADRDPLRLPRGGTRARGPARSVHHSATGGGDAAAAATSVLRSAGPLGTGLAPRTALPVAQSPAQDAYGPETREWNVARRGCCCLSPGCLSPGWMCYALRCSEQEGHFLRQKLPEPKQRRSRHRAQRFLHFVRIAGRHSIPCPLATPANSFPPGDRLRNGLLLAGSGGSLEGRQLRRGDLDLARGDALALLGNLAELDERLPTQQDQRQPTSATGRNKFQEIVRTRPNEGLPSYQPFFSAWASRRLPRGVSSNTWLVGGGEKVHQSPL